MPIPWRPDAMPPLLSTPGGDSRERAVRDRDRAVGLSAPGLSGVCVTCSVTLRAPGLVRPLRGEGCAFCGGHLDDLRPVPAEGRTHAEK